MCSLYWVTDYCKQNEDAPYYSCRTDNTQHAKIYVTVTTNPAKCTGQELSATW